MKTALLQAASVLLLAAGAAVASGGCTTEAFCFADCNTTSGSTSATTSTTSGMGGEGGCGFMCSTSSSVGGMGGGTTSTGTMCDTTSVKSCGTCDNDCFSIQGSNWDPNSVTCDPGSNPGTKPGTCHGTCAPDYWDIDKDALGTCEYYCVKTANDDSTCNGVDDDCDGKIDEDVDLCTSTHDCGSCGHTCTVANGTPQCVHPNGVSCDSTNTHCSILSCTCNGPGDCWWDADGNYANGCEYKCDKTNNGVEICDGIDNDCDGIVDDNLQDPSVGVSCQGGAKGICADPAHAGTSACVLGAITCQGPNVIVPGSQMETCNGVDDDCDGQVDNNTIDTGPAFPCGKSSLLPCQLGVYQCVGGVKTCVGNIDPTPEICDGLDNDCDGTPDDNLMDPKVGVPCDVPTAPPPGVQSACKAGMGTCINGSVICAGATGPTSTADTCGVDANCDGQLTNQPDLMTDVHNCGTCGNDCLAGSVHADWTCTAGQCVFQGCQTGYFDNGAAPDTVAGDHKCGYPCTFAVEQCNGIDDDCDGIVDNNITPPSVASVCGVNPGATSPECTTGITVACVNGAWKCSFSTPGVCNPSCAQAAEICDGLDNNCNGLTDENVPNVGQPCASDSGKPPPGDGVCRTTGTYVCNGANSVACSATKDLTKAGPELCDGLDNDCDGLVDEPFTNKGSNAMYFVKPTVTQVGANPSLFVFTYEASRPNANGSSAGSGNGYYTSAPSGTTLDKTPACSVQGRIPWFDVSGTEVDQTCSAMGGHTCSPTEWMTACQAKSAPATTCTYGYGPAGAACTSGFTAGSKFCNLGMSYDFDNDATNGIQNGLLPTGSSNLKNCYADWTGALGNTSGTNDKIFDITGNLREITKAATNQYTLMGGAFDTASEPGAACSFTFYNVDQNFEFFDTGFRCCFSQDPTQ